MEVTRRDVKKMFNVKRILFILVVVFAYCVMRDRHFNVQECALCLVVLFVLYTILHIDYFAQGLYRPSQPDPKIQYGLKNNNGELFNGWLLSDWSDCYFDPLRGCATCGTKIKDAFCYVNGDWHSNPTYCRDNYPDPEISMNCDYVQSKPNAYGYYDD